MELYHKSPHTSAKGGDHFRDGMLRGFGTKVPAGCAEDGAKNRCDGEEVKLKTGSLELGLQKVIRFSVSRKLFYSIAICSRAIALL